MHICWLGSEPTPEPWDGLAYRIERVGGATEAKCLLAKTLPEIIVIDGAEWAQKVVRSLPPDIRPAVVAVGRSGRKVAASADEWLPSGLSWAEISARLDIAMQRARIHRRLARRALIDPLTNLPNRRAAIRAILRGAAVAKRHGVPLSLVLLDLDDFKSVNERDGHTAGDRLLRKVGATLAASTRADELCARIGGDEFGVVISGEIAQADYTASRLQAALHQVGISASVATGTLQSGEQLRELYRRVDGVLKSKKAERHSTRRARATLAESDVAS